MNEETTVHSSDDEEGSVVRPSRGASRAMLFSFLAMCLLCGVCLWIRFYGVCAASPMSDGVCRQDVYADFDFPYVTPRGECRIYRAGERLARAGEVLDSAGVALVSGYWSFVTSRHEVQRSWQNFVQMMLIMGGMMLCFLFCLHLLRPSFFRHTSNLVLCLLLACLHFVLVTGCYVWMRRQGMYSSMHLLSLLPLCLVPGLATHLLGTRVSICLTLLLTSLTALLMEGEFQFVLFQYSLICSLVGIAVYRPVRRYRQLLLGGVIIVLSVVLLDLMAMWHRNISWPWGELAAFGSMILELSFWKTWDWGSISGELHLSAYWSQLLWFALVNGVFTTLMMLILPKVFEKFFDVISPISLQGLSNLEHPLLERLRKEARGTYEHCMAVGQMAGDAAEAIGADKVLAKTCGFFHDIGKLSDPRCFAENAYAAESPHRFLSPYESSNRIRAHVKQGGELAKKYHLQRPLLEAIRCHHGNDLVVYFYRKAIREAEASKLPMPDEKDFRYEAALPHRSEAVIVEIADICEAASRAELAKLDLVDRKTVKAFVDKLVMGKMEHGQFADADMTLAEFTKVCASMVDSLCSRYHQRPKYTDEDLRPLGPPSGLGMESPQPLSASSPAASPSAGSASTSLVQPAPAVPAEDDSVPSSGLGLASVPVVPSAAPAVQPADASAVSSSSVSPQIASESSPVGESAVEVSGGDNRVAESCLTAQASGEVRFSGSVSSGEADADDLQRHVVSGSDRS